MKRGRILFAFVAVLVLMGLVAGIGVTAYNTGVAQGMAQANGAVTPPAPFPAPYMFPHPFSFGLLGCLMPFLFVFVLLALLRVVFGRPPWRYWGGPFSHARGKWDPSQGDIPPAVQQWHRKLHEQEAQTPKQAAS